MDPQLKRATKAFIGGPLKWYLLGHLVLRPANQIVREPDLSILGFRFGPSLAMILAWTVQELAPNGQGRRGRFWVRPCWAYDQNRPKPEPQKWKLDSRCCAPPILKVKLPGECPENCGLIHAGRLFLYVGPGPAIWPPDFRIATDRASFAFVSASIAPHPARDPRIAPDRAGLPSFGLRLCLTLPRCLHIIA